MFSRSKPLYAARMSPTLYEQIKHASCHVQQNVSNLEQESIVEDVLPRAIWTPELKGGLLNAQAERRSAKVNPMILATYDGELSARTLV